MELVATLYDDDGVQRAHHVTADPDTDEALCAEHLLHECSACGGLEADHPVSNGGAVYCETWTHPACTCDLRRAEA